MIPRHHQTPSKAFKGPLLTVLVSLWILQGCTEVSTQSRPEDVQRPPRIESPSAAGANIPGETGPSVFVSPRGAVKVGSPPVEMEPSPYVHIVRWKGETLSLLSLWYTGSWQNWEEIARVNSGIDPMRITVGDKIRIPENLLKKRKPLPFDLIPSFPGRSRPNKTGGETTTVTGKIEPFGPTEATGKDAPTPEGIELFEPSEIPEEPGLFGPME